MVFSFALNSIFGSALLLVLILIDYYRKFNTNIFQRRIFLKILVFQLLAMGADLVYLSFRGRPGPAAHVLFILTGTVYYFFQFAGYCYVFLLLDFIVFQDINRIKKAVFIAWGIVFINSVFLVLNLFTGYYFTVSPENFYVRGNMFVIRIIIACIPALAIITDTMLVSKDAKSPHKYLWIFYLVLIGAGSAVDIIFQSRTNLVWPCVAASMLIGYFFIIRTDLRTDTITGLGNRYSFIEFIDRAGRGKAGRVYEAAAMGIGNFREINAGLGRQEGDEVLKAMAALIKNAMDKGDFAARYSADEFIIAVKPDSGRDITGMVARIEEAAALYGQNAGKPYTIELNKVFDRHSAGSGVSANEFLARIDSQMSGTRNKHRRSGDK